MTHDPHYDIIVLGGGVAGLWLLNQCLDAGYDAILLEKNTLGGGQTLSSQGMIHGGIKYALGGLLTLSSETIATMPKTWQACLDGTGELDLTGVERLSEDYYLFSDGSLSSRVTSFFGSKAIKSRVTPLDRDQFPAPFDDARFKGWIYRLADLVISTDSLVRHLAKRAGNRVFKADAHPHKTAEGSIKYLDLPGGQQLFAHRYLFAAGEGNGALVEGVGNRQIQMQRRPLHQSIVRMPGLPHVFAHAVSLGTAAKPRLTITTHADQNGQPAWYIGGELAESGVNRSEAEQVQKTHEELAGLFHWMDFTAANIETLRIDRAEAASNSGARPDEPYVRAHQNYLVCWPTKLTLTPLMAKQAMLHITRRGPDGTTNPAPNLPVATVGRPPW